MSSFLDSIENLHNMIKEQYYKRKIGNKYEKLFHKRIYEMSNKNMKKYSTLLVTMGVLLKSL